MDIYSVDERDVHSEQEIDGYRVMLVGEGRVEAFNADQSSFENVRAWAESESKSRGFRYAIAGRTVYPGGKISLTWLTPTPEQIMDELAL